MHKVSRIHSLFLFVRDISLTNSFYKDLGFDIDESGDTTRIVFGDFRIALKQEEVSIENKGIGMKLYFEVDSIEEFVKGISTNEVPVGQPWGKRELKIVDPDGYVLVFFENI